jgi:hypothetical protein
MSAQILLAGLAEVRGDSNVGPLADELVKPHLCSHQDAYAAFEDDLQVQFTTCKRLVILPGWTDWRYCAIAAATAKHQQPHGSKQHRFSYLHIMYQTQSGPLQRLDHRQIHVRLAAMIAERSQTSSSRPRALAIRVIHDLCVRRSRGG